MCTWRDNFEPNSIQDQLLMTQRSSTTAQQGPCMVQGQLVPEQDGITHGDDDTVLCSSPLATQMCHEEDARVHASGLCVPAPMQVTGFGDTMLGRHWFILLDKKFANGVAQRKMSEKNKFWADSMALGVPQGSVIMPLAGGAATKQQQSQQNSFQWVNMLREKSVNFKELWVAPLLFDSSVLLWLTVVFCFECSF